MKLRFFLPVLLLAAPLRAQDAAVPTAAQITERWRAYFESLQKLPAWSYSAHMKLRENDPKNPSAPPKLVNEAKVNFAFDGKKFRRDMQVRENDKAQFQVVMMAYNGLKYQMGVQNPQPTDIGGHKVRRMMMQGAKPFAEDPTLQGFTHFALIMPFIWVGEKIGEQPFLAMSKPETWAEVQKNIAKVEPATREDRPGHKITLNKIRGSEEDLSIEIFVDQETGLPLYSKNVDNKTQKTVGEIKITLFNKPENGAMAFPLQTEISGDGAPGKKGGKSGVGGSGTIEVALDTLKFAGPLDAAQFSIPQNSMEIVMENNNIIYSSFPIAAPKPAQKPAPKKTAPQKPAKK